MSQIIIFKVPEAIKEVDLKDFFEKELEKECITGMTNLGKNYSTKIQTSNFSPYLVTFRKPEFGLVYKLKHF